MIVSFVLSDITKGPEKTFSAFFTTEKAGIHNSFGKWDAGEIRCTDNV